MGSTVKINQLYRKIGSSSAAPGCQLTILVLNGQAWIENKYNHSEYVNFEEDQYPSGQRLVAPTERWSVYGRLRQVHELDRPGHYFRRGAENTLHQG